MKLLVLTAVVVFQGPSVNCLGCIPKLCEGNEDNQLRACPDSDGTCGHFHGQRLIGFCFADTNFFKKLKSGGSAICESSSVSTLHLPKNHCLFLITVMTKIFSLSKFAFQSLNPSFFSYEVPYQVAKLPTYDIIISPECNCDSVHRSGGRIVDGVDVQCNPNQKVYAPFDGQLYYWRPHGGKEGYDCADQGARIEGSGQWQGKANALSLFHYSPLSAPRKQASHSLLYLPLGFGFVQFIHRHAETMLKIETSAIPYTVQYVGAV